MVSVIGVDPGASGAMCLLTKNNSRISMKFWDNEVLLDPDKFFNNFVDDFEKDMESINPDKIVFEKVHSLGNMSAKSNFSFGANVAISRWFLTVISTAYELPFIEITPQKWQKEIEFPSLTKEEKESMDQNQRTKAQKQRALEYALTLYPEAKPYLFTKRGRLLDGRVDALLIAHHGVINE